MTTPDPTMQIIYLPAESRRALRIDDNLYRLPRHPTQRAFLHVAGKPTRRTALAPSVVIDGVEECHRYLVEQGLFDIMLGMVVHAQFGDTVPRNPYEDSAA